MRVREDVLRVLAYTRDTRDVLEYTAYVPKDNLPVFAGKGRPRVHEGRRAYTGDAARDSAYTARDTRDATGDSEVVECGIIVERRSQLRQHTNYVNTHLLRQHRDARVARAAVQACRRGRADAAHCCSRTAQRHTFRASIHFPCAKTESITSSANQ